MKEIDNIGLKLCEYQANLFEQSIDYFDCSSAYFVKVFASSKLAKRMDSLSFLLESLDTSAALSELSKQYELSRGNDKYPSFVMEWIV